MNVPEIQRHFRHAKQIKCLRTNLIISVEHNQGYEQESANAPITSIGGSVVFWKDGQFAEIIKKCDKPCEDCKKNKIIQNKSAMPTFKTKIKTIDAHKYDGKLTPAKRFLGIKNADFDAENRDLILPNSKDVVSVGEYIVKDENGNFSKMTEKQLFENYELVKE